MIIIKTSRCVESIRVLRHPISTVSLCNDCIGITMFSAMALFRCEIFLDFATVALSFVCGKYCPIID